ncbi:hypothetical protein HID58_001178, partial [Brassica napus]
NLSKSITFRVNYDTLRIAKVFWVQSLRLWCWCGGRFIIPRGLQMERCLTVPTSVQNPLTMRIGVGKGILGGEGVPPMRVCKWYPNFLTFGVSSFIRMMMKPMVLLFTGGKRKLQISPKDQRCFSGTSQTILLRIKRLFLKA